MLSYGYWQRRFGGDRGVIGRSIQLDSQTREIVGVMPRGFRVVDRDFDLFVPLAFDRGNTQARGFRLQRHRPPQARRLHRAGRRRRQPADRDMDAHLLQWSRHQSLLLPELEDHPGSSARSSSRSSGRSPSVLWVVMATVGLVMLIACVNIANLLLVRADSRQHELSIRAALGAGRARIARELLFESVTLGLIGGVFALGVAYGGLRLLDRHSVPPICPASAKSPSTARSLAFTLALSVISGFLFGSIPAFKYARTRAAAALSGTNRTASAGRDSPALAQHPGRRAGRHGAGAPHQRASHDSHIRCTAQRRARLHRSRASRRRCGSTFPICSSQIPSASLASQNEIADKIAAIPGVTSVGFRRSCTHGRHRSQLG